MAAGNRRAWPARTAAALGAVVAVVLTVGLDAGQATSAPTVAGPSDPSPPSDPSTLRTSRIPSGVSPAEVDGPPATRLLVTLDRMLGARRGDVSAYAVDLKTGRTVSYGPSAGLATASMVKLDILLTLLLHEQDAGTMPTAGETSLATAMITRSDNDAASALWSTVGRGAGVAAANARFGLTRTVPGPTSYWGSTTTGAADQVRLMSLVAAPNAVLTAPYRTYALDLLRSVESDQRWGASAAGDAGRDDADLALKNGWLPRAVDGGAWVVTSVARVTAAGNPLVVAVLTRRSSTFAAGISLVESVAGQLRTALVGESAAQTG